MPRPKSPEPRSFVVGDPKAYPFCEFRPDTPPYALAAAVFAGNLKAFMDGAIAVEGEPGLLSDRESQSTLSKKAEISQAVLSRILTGAAYPDMGSVARVEDYVGLQLWGGLSDRKALLDGSFRPIARRV